MIDALTEAMEYLARIRQLERNNATITARGLRQENEIADLKEKLAKIAKIAG